MSPPAPRRRRAALVLGTLLALAACTGAPPDSPSVSISAGPAAPAATNATATAPVGPGSTSPAPGTDPRAAAYLCWSAPAAGPGEPAVSDVTTAVGIDAALAGMMVHAVAAGDVNGDSYVDLFVGTFADRPQSEYAVRGATGPAPDRLLLGSAAGFRVSPDFPEMRGRTAGAAFADLDGDGDLDLILSRNPRPKPRADAPSVVLRNDGGRFAPASVLDTTRGGRSIGVVDYDGDGLLDVVLTEDRWTGGSSVLFHNDGGLAFSDRTAAAGLPSDIHALGVSTVDLSGDRRPDLFFSGSNRLFVGGQDGRFVEEAAPEFGWTAYGNEDDVAGVAAADLNDDGRVDLVLGQHYNSTLDAGRRVPIRVYLNEGPRAGRAVAFRDVTSASGIPDLPTKAPHVEIVDLNADGRLDILTTAASGSPGRPVTLINTAEVGQSPQFTAMQPVEPPGEPTYWVTGATFDSNHDGRLEIFLAEWFPQRPSLVLSQSGGSDHWLTVGADVGTEVAVYAAGYALDPAHLLGRREVVASTGFGAGAEPVVRLGLAAAPTVDVVITRRQGEPTTLHDVPGDSFLAADGACG